MKEIWRDIKGYEKFYQVSNFGRVKSKDKKLIDSMGRKRYCCGKILTPVLRNHYLSVGLYDNGVCKRVSVHRIVAKTFLKNEKNYPCINHKDENKENNRFDNLEWCSFKYNRNYGSCPSKLKKQVVQYTVDNKKVKIWQSTVEVGKQLQVSRENISKCCLGKQKTAYGFIWKYLKN